MAVGATLLTADTSQVAGTSHNTASISPGANHLILAWIESHPTATPTLSGNGLTWVQVDQATDGNSRTTLFRAMGASPSSGAVTISHGGTSQDSVSWIIVEHDGTDTTGTNGSGAVVQSAHTNGLVATSITMTLASGIGSGNAVAAAASVASNSDTQTPGSGYTKLGETTSTTEGNFAHEWAASGTTTPSFSSASNTDRWGIAVEIKAAGGGGGGGSFPTVPTQADGRIAGINQTNLTATLTGPNLTALTGRAAGDLIIAIAGEYQSNAGTDAAFTGWAGGGLTWTEIRDSSGTSNTRLGVAFARLVTGSESGAVTVTRSGTLVGDASMILLCIPGAHATANPEATAMATGANTAQADPASLSPSWGSDKTLWIAANGNGLTNISGSWTANNGAPTNYSDFFGTNPSDTSTVGDFGLAVAFRQNEAASEDAGTFSQDTTNARSGALVIAVRPVPGGTQFTADLAGTVAPAGALTRQPNKALAGTVTDSGALAKQARKVLAGATSPVGVFAKQARKALAGAASPSGALTLSRLRLLALAGAIGPSGALAKLTSKPLAGAVSPAGALARQARKALAGATSPSGSLTLAKLKAIVLAGAISPAGALAKQARKALAAATSPSGSLAKQARKPLAGTIGPSGTLTSAKVILRAFAGSIAPTGALTKQARKALSGATSPAATLVKQARKALAGATSPTGTLTKTRLVSIALAGALVPSGALAKRTGKALGSSLSPSGALAKQIGKALAGILAPIGDATVTTAIKVFRGTSRTLLRLFGRGTTSTGGPHGTSGIGGDHSRQRLGPGHGDGSVN